MKRSASGGVLESNEFLSEIHSSKLWTFPFLPFPRLRYFVFLLGETVLSWVYILYDEKQLFSVDNAYKFMQLIGWIRWSIFSVPALKSTLFEGAMKTL